jgi:hypothetical protein
MDLGNFASLAHFVPELILAAGVLAIILADLATRGKMNLGGLAGCSCSIRLRFISAR